ncbi:TPA: DUF1381 domain-containing protein, partial [Staphylococcus aureus]|nr:DUF1381 domain-containing protein [Staphylococcus aureus]
MTQYLVTTFKDSTGC